MPSADHGRRDALPSGTVLREFTIQAVLGHGGFGIVYRAGHNELELTVAIKEYLPVELAVREGATVQPRSGTERKDFAEGLRRFRDEAQALIDFDSHPSIVSCREFFRAHGTAYLVMGYEEGQSLAEVLASREAEGRPFGAADLLGVMRPVLEGLDRVHAAGVLHRDIKPSNILIRRRDGRPVLIDFGAAKQAAARFSKSQAPYTEGYAALEQVADAGKLGPWTDMYGVGAVMWRMVAGGKRPWEPPHPVRVEQRSHAVVGGTEDPMPSARELGKGRFPSQMLEVIDQCLRLRETERMQGSRELLEALREGNKLLPAGSPVAARPLDERTGSKRQEPGSHAAPASAAPRANWRRGGWIALASLVVGLGLVLATWWGSGSEETVRDQAPAGALDELGVESGDPERVEEDSVPSPNQPAKNRSSPPEAGGTAQDPDPISVGSGRTEEAAQAESGRDSEDNLEVSPEPSQDSFVQPWIRDWDALGDINAPDFDLTAQAYIEQYKEVPGASVWVAQAEGLLAKLRELERAENRGSSLEASGTAEDPDPTGIESGAKEEDVGAASGRGSNESLEVRLDGSQDSFVEPWIRDWDALGEMRDPGFADAAQVYIERYKEVPEASVWVARVEGLLAELRGLEAASTTRREAGEGWTNSLGMEFVWVPAGTFLMGSPTDEEGRYRDERQHEVRISEGYWMKKHEVTQGEWEAVMGTNPSYFSDCGPRCPVEEVSWDDTQELIRRLNSRESGNGYVYRLPTEAEWEYGARAGTNGARYGKLREIAWHRGNRGRRTHPVGQKRPNAWGVHDMLGNVWEWTGDWYRAYPSGPVTDPGGPGSGSLRVIRGGSWGNDARSVRSADRGTGSSGARGSDLGFRLVRTE